MPQSSEDELNSSFDTEEEQEENREAEGSPPPGPRPQLIGEIREPLRVLNDGWVNTGVLEVLGGIGAFNALQDLPDYQYWKGLMNFSMRSKWNYVQLTEEDFQDLDE